MTLRLHGLPRVLLLGVLWWAPRLGFLSPAWLHQCQVLAVILLDSSAHTLHMVEAVH